MGFNSLSEAIYLQFTQPIKNQFLNSNQYANTLKTKFQNHGQIEDIKLTRHVVKSGDTVHKIQIFYKNPQNVLKYLEHNESIELNVQGEKIRVPCVRDLSCI